MRFAVIDASPRGEKSNSAAILSWTVAGMESAGAVVAAVTHLAEAGPDSGHVEAMAAIDDADAVLIAFPLYTDFVPGLLKAFLDALASRGPTALDGKALAWIVHSGFPESAQIEPTAAWLRRASARLGAKDAGVAIRGGSEGFRLMPEAMTARVRRLFGEAGASLAAEGAFDPRVVAHLARPRRLPWLARLAMRAFAGTVVVNGYWIAMLRRHGAMARRFDAPYGEAYRDF